MTWKEYKKLIGPTIKDYKEAHFFVLSCGLGSEVGELIKCDFEDYKINKSNNTPRSIKIGDLLWYLAALETTYQLPDNLYAHLFNVQLNTPELDKVDINSDLFSCTGKIISLMHQGELQDLQYALNNFAAVILDYADFHLLNLEDCMKASLLKFNLRKTAGKKQPVVEYNSVRKMIKEAGKEELLIEAKFLKSKYVNISVKYKGTEKIFTSGDLIVDFFYASSYINDNFKGTGYVMNFGPKIRNFLKSQSDILSGFIIEEELVSSISLRKSGKSTMQGYQQSFFRKDMTKINQLLDYINDKKQNA